MENGVRIIFYSENTIKKIILTPFSKLRKAGILILIISFLSIAAGFAEGEDAERLKKMDLLMSEPKPEPKPIAQPKKNKGNFPGPAQIEVQAQEIEKLKQENEQLRKELVSLEDKSRKEKATLYQELGDVYTEAKLFDLAIDAYKQSLSFNPDVADVHYRLGLLYKHSRSDAQKGVVHLKKYLQLNPEAKDKREIEYLIEMMSRKPFP